MRPRSALRVFRDRGDRHIAPEPQIGGGAPQFHALWRDRHIVRLMRDPAGLVWLQPLLGQAPTSSSVSISLVCSVWRRECRTLPVAYSSTCSIVAPFQCQLRRWTRSTLVGRGICSKVVYLAISMAHHGAMRFLMDADAEAGGRKWPSSQRREACQSWDLSKPAVQFELTFRLLKKLFFSLHYTVARLPADCSSRKTAGLE